MHEMFWQATRLLGNDATYEEITTAMNPQSAGLQDMQHLPWINFLCYNGLRRIKRKKDSATTTVNSRA
jgi:hypothetical protein